MTEAARHDWLPGVLADIARAAGLAAALKLARAHGGTRIYIPARLDETHWLARLVGHAEARAIIARLSPGRLDIPRGPTGTMAGMRRALDEMIAAGQSESAIARTLGITDRTVRRAKARARRRAGAGQKSLF